MSGSPLNLFLSRPELLLAHGQRYATLVGAEVSLAAAQARRRVTLGLLAAALAVAGATLFGMAAMLHLSLPDGLPLAAWTVPVVAAVAALVAGLGARAGSSAARPFHALKQELSSDLQWMGMAAMVSRADAQAREEAAAVPDPSPVPPSPGAEPGVAR